MSWRPALIDDNLPVPLTGADATAALQQWAAARTCTDLSPTPGPSEATAASESQPVPSVTAAPLSVDG